MPAMLSGLRLTRPGLFITGTDTGVGKTAVACGIAAAIRRQEPSLTLGVSKPFSSGCRKEREGLVHEDAEALAHYADCRLALDVINPIRFAAPLAPAVAAEQAQTPIDWAELRRALESLDAQSDALLIEGVGGLLVPLDPRKTECTVLKLIAAIGYPALVVARSTLGTLNHTAMTARLLSEAGCRVAGVVMNRYEGDVAAAEDPSITTNRRWIEKMTGVKVLAVAPRVDPGQVVPHRGRLDPAVVDALATVRWSEQMRKPKRTRQSPG